MRQACVRSLSCEVPVWEDRETLYGSCITSDPRYSFADPGCSVQTETQRERGGKTGTEVCLFQNWWYFLSLIFDDLEGSFLSPCEAKNIPVLVLFLVLVLPERYSVM